MKRITVLGIACVDIIVSGYKKIPEPGKLEFTDDMRLYTGGCALNCSIDLSKMGIKHNLIIPVGDDVFGEFIKKSVKMYNICNNRTLTLKNAYTSSSVVLLDKSGERSFLHNPGANAKLDIKNIDLDLLQQSDILFIGGALLMPNFDGPQMAEVLRVAQQAGVYTVLDIGWDASGKWMEILEPVLPYVDLFVPSFDEAIKLSGSVKLDEIFTFFKTQKIEKTIIKLGEKGAAFWNGHNVEIIPSIPIKRVVDTTGAGDSFVSGILTGLASEWGFVKTIQFANTVGSLCVMNFGASEGVKDLDYIESLRRQHYE